VLSPRRALVSLLLVLLTAGCGAVITESPRLAALQLQLLAENGSPIPLDGERVDVSITGSGIAQPIFASFRFEGDSVVAELQVPIGRDRLVAVAVFDSANVLVASGETLIDVGSGGVADVSVPIAPSSGDQPIVVTVGGTRVSVTPGTLNLLTGQSTPLTVSITDLQDQPLAGAVPSFASSNPALVSVTPAGLVTGNQQGVTAVTVTALGVAARVPVSVSLSPLQSP